MSKYSNLLKIRTRNFNSQLWKERAYQYMMKAWTFFLVSISTVLQWQCLVFLKKIDKKVIFGGNWNLIEYTSCLKKITNNYNFQIKIISKYPCTCICFFYVKFFVKHDCHVIFWIYKGFCLSDFNNWRGTWCSLWAPTFI